MRAHRLPPTTSRRAISRSDATRCIACLLFAWALISGHQPAEASDRVGTYGLIEAVERIPVEDGPDKIVLDGVFALSYRPVDDEGRRSAGIYTDPDRGRLYFQCPAGQAEACALQWADLEAAVGDERCAAFGDRYHSDPEPNGRLRAPGETLVDPDLYALGMGVAMVRFGEREVCEDLRVFAAEGQPEEPPAEPTDPPATEAAEDTSLNFLPKIDGKAYELRFESPESAFPTLQPIATEDVESDAGGLGWLVLAVGLLSLGTIAAARRRDQG